MSATEQLVARMDNPHLAQFGTRDQFIEKSLPLAEKIGRKYLAAAKTKGMDLDDIVSFAYEGLIKAYDRFDSNKTETQNFEAYAYRCISGAIKTGMTQTNVDFRYRWETKQAVIRIYKQDLQDCSVDEVVEKIGLKQTYVEEALSIIKSGKVLSMDAPVKQGQVEDGYILSDTVGREGDYSTVAVEEFMDLLDETEKSIANSLMYGLKERVIAKRMGMKHKEVQERITTIQRKFERYTRGEKGRETDVAQERAHVSVVPPLRKDQHTLTLNDLTVDDYQNLVENGYKDHDIARKYGTPFSKLYAWKREQGVVLPLSEEQYGRYRQQGMTNKEIAAKHGISVATLYDMRQKWGNGYIQQDSCIQPQILNGERKVSDEWFNAVREEKQASELEQLRRKLLEMEEELAGLKKQLAEEKERCQGIRSELDVALRKNQVFAAALKEAL
ncbi:sigma-70 family RNA polymerase sigma factor [Aneurinibacillus soli]|nr:sigma-70 family RNA polymerase sigma factor [Aneurinibacillus soli]